MSYRYYVRLLPTTGTGLVDERSFMTEICNGVSWEDVRHSGSERELASTLTRVTARGCTTVDAGDEREMKTKWLLSPV